MLVLKNNLIHNHIMYTYNEVYNSTLNYFNQDELATKVAIDKYLLRDYENNFLERSPYDMHKRLAKEFFRIETQKYNTNKYITSEKDFSDNFKYALSEDFIFSLLDRFKYIVPQGSVLYGVGNHYQYVTLSNCYLLEIPQDSYSSILKIDEQLVNISKRRGGVGIDISNIRPYGFPTKNSSRISTGIIPFMERYSNSIREVGQHGRRGALMLTIDVHHPQVLDFARSKIDRTKVTGANISIRLSQEFISAVEKNKNYEQRFPVNARNPVFRQEVNAREVWMEIVKIARDTAEPGILMWNNVQKYTPADCYERFRSCGTNPCSEINLSPLDSCRLMCLNLYSYVKAPFSKDAEFDFEKFSIHAQICQRLMDDLVDLESESISRILNKIDSDPEDEETKFLEKRMWEKIKILNDDGRRTGTGITALADTLAALNITYGSNKSIEKTAEIYKNLKLACYRSSVNMAKLLGPFKDWNFHLEKNNEFLLRIKEEDPDLYNDMKKYGRRNVSLLTTAPTGSVSILTQTSSGIEPVFLLEYTRRKKINPNDTNAKIDFIDQNGDAWQEFTVYHPKLKDWMNITGLSDITNSPYYKATAEEINWSNRVKLQAAAQQHVCHSISSTINLPEDISVEEVKKIYDLATKLNLKGITIYRKNCRSGVLIEQTPAIVYSTAPKRPAEILADVYHFTKGGQPYFILVGKIKDQPFEIFAGKNNNDLVHRSSKRAKILKLGKGRYKAILDDNTELSPLSAFIDKSEESFTRLVSLALRHGASPEFILTQLEKDKSDLNSLAKVIAKSLKHYVKDGKTSTNCPECQNELWRIEGCLTCKSCGWSKC